MRHACINTTQREQIARRLGRTARVIPNVMDFEHPPAGPDGYSSHLRSDLGVADDHLKQTVIMNESDLVTDPPVTDAAAVDDDHDGAVDLSQETLRGFVVTGNDALGVAGTVVRDMGNGLLDAVNDAHRQDRVQVFGRPVFLGRRNGSGHDLADVVVDRDVWTLLGEVVERIGVDLADGSLLLWKMFNNVDPGRDLHLQNHRLVIDACKKGVADGHTREWPDELRFD